MSFKIVVDVTFEVHVYKQNNPSSEQKFFNQAIGVLLFLLVARLVANYWIPFNDTTEARYGEIARKMLETDNWVNLLHNYGIPFWAKPPLSTWFSALSMKLFGISEWAARLPSVIFSIGILGLIAQVAKKQSDSETALVSVLILSGMAFFFLGSGAVMTDPALTFCTTLSLISFWQALHTQSRIWAYGFFVGLGLGLLAKGPLILILCGLPVFFWVLLHNQWRKLWTHLPWFQGSFLTCAIALPWYLLAEHRTPGFLNYFILGEHINRFLIPGWTGDKYGIAHHAPKGIIWIFALIGAFPWSIVLGKWFVAQFRKKQQFLSSDQSEWFIYLLLCTLVPLLFFTFASNIIYPYVFPSLPPFALLFAEMWRRTDPQLIGRSGLLGLTAINGILFLIGTFLFVVTPDWVATTQKPVVEAWIQQRPNSVSHLIYWEPKTEFSAQFYSSGKVKATVSLNQLSQWLSNGVDNYVVVNAKKLSELTDSELCPSTIVKTFASRGERVLLLHYPACNSLGATLLYSN